MIRSYEIPVKRIKIHVTQEDIDKGCKGKTSSCPIARAMLREIPGADSVCVGGADAAVWDADGNYADYLMSREALRFVIRFDTDKPTKPFNFYLTPDPWERERYSLDMGDGSKILV